MKRRETVQEQAVEEEPAFALTLASFTGTVRLALPATDTKVDLAKQALGLDNLERAVIRDTEIDYPCYDMQGTERDPGAHAALVDYTALNHSGTVLSPVPLMRPSTAARKIGRRASPPAR